MATRNHGEHISKLRNRAMQVVSQERAEVLDLAADLLDMHDRETINLGTWSAARNVVQILAGIKVEDNGV